MTLDEALRQACDHVGIREPRRHVYGRWINCDTLSGKNGKGDGRVIINDTHVTAKNWQTGETKTVSVRDEVTAADRREISRQIRVEQVRKQELSLAAAKLASAVVERAILMPHAYLASKGFKTEKVLTIGADALRQIVVEKSSYLFPDACQTAIVVPARVGSAITSVQFIWEDGTKKFLFGGTISGASSRIAAGAYTWLCEGLATGLSIRAALHGLKIRSTILCCFAAANVMEVAKQTSGRVFIAAENDRPQPQFGGLGTSEFYAKQTALPYGMPELVGTDFNDMHQSHDIYAVQRALMAVMTPRSNVSRGSR